jgi:predicted amino acid racemase
MFLELLKRRNPGLLEMAGQLHQAGEIPANCYVIDVDAVRRNATRIREEAVRLGLTVFAMTKQFGRNPDVCRAIAATGITEAVGVDLECAVAATAGGLDIGHIGHLVQLPRSAARAAAALNPRFWTVFSEVKAREAATASRELGRTQRVLVRVVAPGDRFYRGHEGGVALDEIVAFADLVDGLDGAEFAGVTTFPAMLYDSAQRSVAPTPNLTTLQHAVEALREAGRTGIEVNAPGTTSTATLQALADAGATQVEPGHGFTGTTPWHAFADLVEEPAIAYVSEVSHVVGNEAFVFGGGLYADPVLGERRESVLVVTDPDSGLADATTLPVEMPAPEAIDYYCVIDTGGKASMSPGSTVIFGFRPQVFVTRGLTAAIEGVSTGSPTVVGLWAATGAAPPAAPQTLSR